MLIYTLESLFTSSFFFFNDTATTEIYTLSLHDALPICFRQFFRRRWFRFRHRWCRLWCGRRRPHQRRSEEHTSELQSPDHIVCRLLLEKKIMPRTGRAFSALLNTALKMILIKFLGRQFH